MHCRTANSRRMYSTGTDRHPRTCLDASPCRYANRTSDAYDITNLHTYRYANRTSDAYSNSNSYDITNLHTYRYANPNCNTNPRTNVDTIS